MMRSPMAVFYSCILLVMSIAMAVQALIAFALRPPAVDVGIAFTLTAMLLSAFGGAAFVHGRDRDEPGGRA